MEHKACHTIWIKIIVTFLVYQSYGAVQNSAFAQQFDDAIAYTVEEKNFTDTAFGYRYLMYLPTEYTAKNKPWPVLFYLHGAGTYGTDLNRLKPQVPVRFMVKDGKLPFVVVAPMSRDREFWNSGNVNTFIKEVLLKNNLDRSRVYLTGMSRGGHGTFITAGDFPRRFAAIAPIAGAGGKVKADELKSMGVWAFHGALDDVIPIQYTSVLMQELNRVSKNDVKYTVYQNEGHGIWEKAYSTTALYDWFLTQKNPDPIR